MTDRCPCTLFALFVSSSSLYNDSVTRKVVHRKIAELWLKKQWRPLPRAVLRFIPNMCGVGFVWYSKHISEHRVRRTPASLETGRGCKHHVLQNPRKLHNYLVSKLTSPQCRLDRRSKTALKINTFEKYLKAVILVSFSCFHVYLSTWNIMYIRRVSTPSPSSRGGGGVKIKCFEIGPFF